MHDWLSVHLLFGCVSGCFVELCFILVILTSRVPVIVLVIHLVALYCRSCLFFFSQFSSTSCLCFYRSYEFLMDCCLFFLCLFKCELVYRVTFPHLVSLWISVLELLSYVFYIHNNYACHYRLYHNQQIYCCNQLNN